MNVCKVLCISTLAMVAAAAPQHEPAGEPVARLTVRGDAQLERPADQLNIRIGAVTESEDAIEAINDNNDRMNKVTSAIRMVGLSEKEYQTGTFNVQPVYSQRPRGAGPDWAPHITGYRVTNSLTIKTRKLAKAGELIQAVSEAGANTINSIHFDLADPRTHRGEAITAATSHALDDARALAEAAGVKLVRILSLDLDQADAHPVSFPYQRMGMAAEAATAPPITPGDVTVRASVTVVYEISG